MFKKNNLNSIDHIGSSRTSEKYDKQKNVLENNNALLFTKKKKKKIFNINKEKKNLIPVNSCFLFFILPLQ